MVTKAEFEAAITRIAIFEKEMLRLKKVEDENEILNEKVAELRKPNLIHLRRRKRHTGPSFFVRVTRNPTSNEML